MLFLFSGTDRNKARDAASAHAARTAGKGGTLVRVTDAHSCADIESALRGGGMFGGAQTVVLDSVVSSGSEEARALVLAALGDLGLARDTFVMLEGALDAATRKQIEKHAEKSERFDSPKTLEEKTIFALAHALQRGDKKALWVGLMREYAKGSAPEAVHGLLFWGAKQLCLRENSPRARALVARLAVLPHEARRSGEDMGYALERFALVEV